jgi:hypothetical protein
MALNSEPWSIETFLVCSDRNETDFEKDIDVIASILNEPRLNECTN